MLVGREVSREVGREEGGRLVGRSVTRLVGRSVVRHVGRQPEGRGVLLTMTGEDGETCAGVKTNRWVISRWRQAVLRCVAIVVGIVEVACHASVTHLSCISTEVSNVMKLH